MNNNDNDTSDDVNNDNDLVNEIVCVPLLTYIFKLFLQNKIISKGFPCFDFHLVDDSCNLSLPSFS